MIATMAEECGDPTVKLPRAISWCVPVGGIAGLFFVSYPDIANTEDSFIGEQLRGLGVE
jgi:hypothetical protein